jgi:phage tail sheath gpL-like
MKMRFVVNTNRNNLVSSFNTQGGPSAWYLRKLSDLFGAFSLGAWQSNTVLVTSVVAASGTVTLSSIAQNDTVTIGKTVFTGKDAPSTSVQFLTGTTDTLSAVSLAAKINAHAQTSKIVSATSALGVVTLTSLIPGLIGNEIALAISAHGSVSATYMASGTEGTTSTFAHGL